MEVVAECSENLFWAGVLYEAYFTLFLLRVLMGLSIACCVKKPKNFWMGWNSFGLCFDAIAFTWLTIWAAMQLFKTESVQCHKDDPDGVGNYWFLVAICVVLGMIYSLILFFISCMFCTCLCLVSCMMYRQGNFGGDAMQTAASRVPMASAAMERIGRKNFTDLSQKSKEMEMCIICQENYTPESVVSELNCDDRHIFHEPCLKMWLEQKLECPICKKAVSALPEN